MDARAKERFDLITANLAEVLNPEIIEGILAEGRNPRVYWGMLSSPFFFSTLQRKRSANEVQERQQRADRIRVILYRR